MNESTSSRRIVRFGIFELDLASEELRKNGLKIKLSGQPFQILGMLLERPGQVVTREELQKKLWPDGTFVDFDHSLNTAINKIREALGDSAENPRFVETLARRGYRFIAPVERVRDDRPAQIAAERTKTEEAAEVPPQVAGQAPTRDLPRPRERLATVALLALATAAALVALWWFKRPESQIVGSLKLSRLTSDSGLTTDGVISPDGRLVAYASDRSGDGNLDIWVRQVAGGEPVRLTQNSADDQQPDFSPDGSQIVFRSERDGGGIYLISALGGRQERLLVEHGRNPRFAPDGNRIAYWAGIVMGKPLGGQATNGSLFVMATSGGAPRRTLSDFASAGCPIWSPDGKYLLFYGSAEGPFPHEDASSDWWVVSAEGGRPVKSEAIPTFRRQQIESQFPGLVPLPTQWIDNLIFFYAQTGDSVNLWRVSISPETFQVAQPAQRLTSGSGLETRPSIAKDGTLVFSSLTENGDLWRLSLDTNRAKSPGLLEQVTEGDAAEYSPSVSADGKTVAFVSDRSGNPDIWMKNLDTGQYVRLTPTQESEAHPEISADGTLVAYSVRGGIQIVPTQGGVADVVCQDCGYAWDFTSENRRLSFHQAGRVDLLDISSRTRTSLLKPSGSAAWQAKFSPDGRWVLFGVAAAAERSRLFVAPFQGEAAIAERDWISLSDGSSWDDKPRWSSDGNLVYFTSERDGFTCLWAQQLDHSSKRPREAPFPVYHFHQARRSMSNVGYWTLEISVARDKIVFNLMELTGNIWVTKVDLK